MINDGRRWRDTIPNPPRWVSNPGGKVLLTLLTYFEEAESENMENYEETESVIETVFLDQFQFHLKFPLYAALLIGICFVINWFTFPVGSSR